MTEATRPQNLLVVASHDWPFPMIASLAIARWHEQADRPHLTIHTISSIGGPPFDPMDLAANPVICHVLASFAAHGIPLRQHDPALEPSPHGRRSAEIVAERVLNRPKPGQEIDHVIALILDNDRTPSTAIMHANMLGIPNPIIRINENGRV